MGIRLKTKHNTNGHIIIKTLFPNFYATIYYICYMLLRKRAGTPID